MFWLLYKLKPYLLKISFISKFSVNPYVLIPPKQVEYFNRLIKLHYSVVIKPLYLSNVSLNYVEKLYLKQNAFLKLFLIHSSSIRFQIIYCRNHNLCFF